MFLLARGTNAAWRGMYLNLNRAILGGARTYLSRGLSKKTRATVSDRAERGPGGFFPIGWRHFLARAAPELARLHLPESNTEGRSRFDQATILTRNGPFVPEITGKHVKTLGLPFSVNWEIPDRRMGVGVRRR